MRPTYNKSKIMRNAWYLKRVQSAKSFGECLRKAWRNEKLRIVRCLAEGLPIDEPKASTYNQPTEDSFVAGCIAYYQNAPAGTYFGD